jgi:signal transduction histidine kinase
LIQALLNLLHNAMKFSGSSRRIELSAARADGTITLRVSDHGIGIDPAEHKKIFERFYRAALSNPERIPGTGLGLTIVSHIVNAHQGSIVVESAPGRGSTFSITFPLGSPLHLGARNGKWENQWKASTHSGARSAIQPSWIHAKREFLLC